ncbi:hypothetical protein [Lentzea waywayandensis]|uniref:hypothetical protein n=1 Tax=Lentzea waywayandensis TaxID=84724 RepID=UPI0011601B91|nr:hypothetical protein [Lentzea waywayandensis]
MGTYAETKEQLLLRVQGVRAGIVRGVPLKGGRFGGFFPIRPCLCVTEPCPCDDLGDLDDLIIWLPVSNQGRGTGSRAGSDEVLAYEVEHDDRVLVEVQIPMTIAQLRKIKEWSDREQGERSDRVTVRKGGKVSPSQAILGAFLVGYALGEKIDEGTGLSESISDWAADNIPWPW